VDANFSLEAIGAGQEFADEARYRIKAFLGWQGGAGSRALSPAAVAVLRQHVVAER